MDQWVGQWVVVWSLWLVRLRSSSPRWGPPPGPLALMVQERPCLRALSYLHSLQHPSLVIFIGHDSWGEWGCGLILYGPIKLPYLRHTGRCRARDWDWPPVYGQFLVINLEWEGRVIACCWGAEWGAGAWAMPWKGKVEPVLPQGHSVSAAKKNRKRIFSFPTFLCHYRHRFDQVLAKRKLLFWGFFFKIPWCLRGGLSSEA